MKKLGLWVLMLVLCLSLCACGEPALYTQGQLLYDCGAVTASDTVTYSFVYDGYDGDPLTIKYSDDYGFFAYYTYDSDCPADQLTELETNGATTFTVTVNDKAYTFYLNEENGSLISRPDGEGQTAKVYVADEDHQISAGRLYDWILKYEV